MWPDILRWCYSNEDIKISENSMKHCSQEIIGRKTTHVYGKGSFMPFHLLELNQRDELVMDLPSERDRRNNLLSV